MNKYYYLKGDRQHGPVTVDELKTQGATRETMVWMEGMADWVAAKDVAEIAAALPPPAPIVVTPPPPPLETRYSASLKSTNETPNGKSNAIWLVSGGAILILFFLWATGFFNQLVETNNDPVIDPNPNPVVNDDLHQRKLNIINNWPNFISSDLLSAKYNEFGGMSDVFIAVRNETEFSVDLIRCQIKYIKPNGDIYKTEIMDVGPFHSGEYQEVQAPGSHRGSKILVEAIAVRSKEIGLDAHK